MTRTTTARIAGATFLVYIAAGVTSMIVSRRATAGGTIAERLTTIVGHATDVGFIVLLGFVQAFSAVILAVTLWAITRDEDSDLAMLGLACRLGEGVIGGLSVVSTLAVLSLATSSATDPSAAAAAQTLARYLLRPDFELPATFFAVGSMSFSWLLLRGRMIPVPLAWLGVVASALLVVVLPLTLAKFLRGPITMLVWLPMLIFELALAGWLLTRGVAPPMRAHTL